MTSISRDNKIDFIKFIGLSLIILAHVHPPFVLFQIRCFDVPLMLFASGLAFSGKSIDNYIKFVLPRTKRLICPLYVFLSVYFAILFICGGGSALKKWRAHTCL